MDQHKREIESLNQTIIDYQEVASLEAVLEAEDMREDVEPELSKVMQDEAFEQFLAEYLTEAKREQRDGERDGHLCSCARPTCPVKNESLPPQVVRAENLDDGIRTYQREHIGDAKVLTDARDAYIAACADVKSTLRRALGAIRAGEVNDSTEAEA